MNRRILVQASAPAVVIGLLMFAACLFSAWYINRLQANIAEILSSNVTSLHATQQLEKELRQLRFRCFLYLIDPQPELLADIQEHERRCAFWMGRARDAACAPEEFPLVAGIEAGYGRYRQEFDELRAQVGHDGPRRDFRQLAATNPVGLAADPCQKLFDVNEGLIVGTARESDVLSRKMRLALLLRGVGGPVSGLVLGYGIARGLSRSIYKLHVHVQDLTRRLDRGVTAVRVVADGDFQHLDKQLQHAVRRVGEVVQDLQRQQQDVLRAQQLAAVGQLAASVAHEVRNPLTSIKMLVEAALRLQKPRPFTRENLEVVHGEVVRLEQTVQSFLAFARPPALRRSPCDLRDVVGQAAGLVRARADQQRVGVDLRLPAEAVPAQVDGGQLGTVFVNLFLNALDAMPNGGRLDVELDRAGAGEVCCRVRDTGGGIPPAVLGRLFTPFASTKPTGTGLGLSISRRIVEEHGGRLSAANAAGGACFVVRLPALAGE
jgi:signal transduction histidine kinase